MKFNLNFLHAIRRLKWDWAGHVARLENNKWAKQVLDWGIKEGRKRGKQKLRWRDEIDQLYGHKQFRRIAGNRRQWERLR